MTPAQRTPHQRSDFRFFQRLRVRWAEVDMQKIVFNAHYLMYFDTAMADYWRALCLPYQDTMDALQGDLYVAKATVTFHASARVDDQLDVALKCHHLGRSSLVFQGAIFRGDEHLISAELVYVFADPRSQTSQALPTALRDTLLAYEAGEAMSTVRVGPWSTLGADAQSLRTEVFVHEQHIPQTLERDAADASALHAVAYNRLGQAVATARCLGLAGTEGPPEQVKIGRMAVHRTLRGAGLGRDVLHALMAAARQQGAQAVQLYAQRSAVGFYSRLGFACQGEPFMEAGIEHIEMGQRL